MKKCPYCAEEIQDDAVICRFCNRKVKGRWIKKVFLFFLLAGMIFAVLWGIHLMRGYSSGIQDFVEDLNLLWEAIKEIVTELKTATDGFENR